ncbi:hypothetical protein [Candidatus Paracaedibacter symbiosus]|uniref:DUF2795 domain-containing protein n=1 Tax=Candidatus Paracaedibacter symbiosus TaxID=244582 RepID=UPI0005098CF9|nr:hypothetical protein [Candidatus Paracaedibacter symbiosus]
MVNKNKDGCQESGKKASEGGRDNPEKASPAAIERYLEGIKYPASKQDLTSQAKKMEPHRMSSMFLINF